MGQFNKNTAYNLSSDKQLGSQTSKMNFRLLLVLMAFFALAMANRNGKNKDQKPRRRPLKNDEGSYTPPPRDTPRRCREGVHGPECQRFGSIGGGREGWGVLPVQKQRD